MGLGNPVVYQRLSLVPLFPDCLLLHFLYVFGVLLGFLFQTWLRYNIDENNTFSAFFRLCRISRRNGCILLFGRIYRFARGGLRSSIYIGIYLCRNVLVFCLRAVGFPLHSLNICFAFGYSFLCLVGVVYMTRGCWCRYARACRLPKVRVSCLSAAQRMQTKSAIFL